MTYGQITSSFYAYVGQPADNSEFNSSQVNVFCNEAYRTLIREEKTYVETKTTVLSQKSITLDYNDVVPSTASFDSIEILSVEYKSNTNNERYYLTEQPYDQLFSNYYDAENSSEQYSVYFGFRRQASESMILYPAPESGSTLYFHWYAVPQADLSDTVGAIDSFIFPNSYQSLISKKAAYDALVSSGDERAGRFHKTVVMPQILELREWAKFNNRRPMVRFGQFTNLRGTYL